MKNVFFSCLYLSIALNDTAHGTSHVVYCHIERHTTLQKQTLAKLIRYNM